MTMHEPDHEATERRLLTLPEVQAALAQTLAEALQAGVPEIIACDPDFSFWPLNGLPFVEALARWALPHRRWVMVAQHYDLVRRHPRFVQWRTTWAHVVDARAPDGLQEPLPSMLLAGPWCVEIVDRERGRGRVWRDPGRARQCREELDVILQRSSPSFAATTLGL
jgi:hypothetical protein